MNWTGAAMAAGPFFKKVWVDGQFAVAARLAAVTYALEAARDRVSPLNSISKPEKEGEFNICSRVYSGAFLSIS